jgi:hypothetical protein
VGHRERRTYAGKHHYPGETVVDTLVYKKPKKSGCAIGIGTPPPRKKSVSAWGSFAQNGIEPKYYMCLNIFLSLYKQISYGYEV